MHRVLMVFAIAFCTEHASAQSQTQCTVARPAADYAAKQSQPPVPVETPIWKTITVGGSKGVNAVRHAMDTAPCPIWVGEEADEILGRPAFPFNTKPFEL